MKKVWTEFNSIGRISFICFSVLIVHSNHSKGRQKKDFVEGDVQN